MASRAGEGNPAQIRDTVINDVASRFALTSAPRKSFQTVCNMNPRITPYVVPSIPSCHPVTSLISLRFAESATADSAPTQSPSKSPSSRRPRAAFHITQHSNLPIPHSTARLHQCYPIAHELLQAPLQVHFPPAHALLLHRLRPGPNPDHPRRTPPNQRRTKSPPSTPTSRPSSSSATPPPATRPTSAGATTSPTTSTPPKSTSPTAPAPAAAPAATTTKASGRNVLAEMKPGDYVLIQMGHNDGGSSIPQTTPRPATASRASATKPPNSPSQALHHRSHRRRNHRDHPHLRLVHPQIHR